MNRPSGEQLAKWRQACEEHDAAAKDTTRHGVVRLQRASDEVKRLGVIAMGPLIEEVERLRDLVHDMHVSMPAVSDVHAHFAPRVKEALDQREVGDE